MLDGLINLPSVSGLSMSCLIDRFVTGLGGLITSPIVTFTTTIVTGLACYGDTGLCLLGEFPISDLL